MRGNPRNQAGQIFRPLARIGKSRHADKQAARAAGHRGSHKIAQVTGVYSYRTLTEYRKHTAAFLQYVRDTHGVKDAAKIQPEHVRDYLRLKMIKGVRFKTWQTYAAALNKAAAGLKEIYGTETGWTEIIAEERQTARQVLARDIKPRAYLNPSTLINQLTDNHKTAAQIQYHAGARIKEITRLTKSNLLKRNRIKLTNTKGGRIRVIEVPPNIYQKVANEIKKTGTFTINYKHYLADLQAAALETGQPYTGSHGLRWNYAQESMKTLQEQGRTYDQALTETADHMGHTRPEITEHYLQ